MTVVLALTSIIQPRWFGKYGNFQSALTEKLPFFRDISCAELLDLKEEKEMPLKVEINQLKIEDGGHLIF